MAQRVVRYQAGGSELERRMRDSAEQCDGRLGAIRYSTLVRTDCIRADDFATDVVVRAAIDPLARPCHSGYRASVLAAASAMSNHPLILLAVFTFGLFFVVFFFFQAEDGIRDSSVTGVQIFR